MTKREYLILKLQNLLEDDYEDAEPDILPQYDRGESSIEKLTKVLLEYTGKGQIEKLAAELQDMKFWSKEEPEYPRSELLKWKLTVAMGSKYNQKRVAAELLTKLEEDPVGFKAPQLRSYLEKNAVDDEVINKLLADLETQKFWDVEDPSADPINYQSEQSLLNNCEIDYRAIPDLKKKSKPEKDKDEDKDSQKQTLHDEPVERILYRCIIIALLIKEDQSIVKPTLEQFKSPFTIEQLKKEVELLQKAIEMENRSTVEISKSLDKIKHFSPAASEQTIQATIYGHLAVTKKELIPIDTPDLLRLIAKTEEVESEISSKNIFLFIGETGSGKTTTIKTLLGYKMGMRKFKKMNWLTIVEKITDPKVLAMQSNPECKSVTRYIVAVKPKPHIKAGDYYFADTPGWGDTAGVEVQLANYAGVRKALEGCKTLIPVIVISKQSWGKRGDGIRDLARTVSTLFQDFEAIKNSVAIVFNRFTKDELGEMEHKFESMLKNMNSSDAGNANFSNFIKHLHNIARTNKLLTFEPLADDPQRFIDILMDKSSLKPANLFQNSIPASSAIKSYCSEIAKRVRYHLKNNNPDMVKYFVDQLERLYGALDEQSIHTEVKTIKKEIETIIREDFKRIVDDFSIKILGGSINRRDIVAYFRDTRNLVQRRQGYNTLVENLDLVSQAETKYQETVKDLVVWFMRQRKRQEEDDPRNLKTLEMIRVLYETRSTDDKVSREYRNLKKWIAEKVVKFLREFEEALNKPAYEIAAEIYETAIIYLKYQKNYEGEKVEGQEAVSKLAEGLNKQIHSHFEKFNLEAKNLIKRCEHKGLAQIDGRFIQLVGCYKFMSAIEGTLADEIKQKVNQFVSQLKALGNKEHQAIAKIISAARSTPIARKQKQEFEASFERLTSLSQIQSINSNVESQLEQIRGAIDSYIESQQFVLENASDKITTNPQELKSSIGSIQAALKGIQELASFGGEDTKSKAMKIMDETVKKMEVSLPKIFEGMGGRNTIKYYEAPERIFKKMCEMSDMEVVFSKLDKFQAEYQQLKERNADNEKKIIIALDEAKDCVNYLKINEEEDLNEKELNKKLYENISLNRIEMAVKFFELVSSSYNSHLQKIAKDNLEESRMYLKLLRIYCSKTMNRFADLIINPHKDTGFTCKIVVEASSLLKCNHDLCEIVGERCRQIWRWTRRVYKIVNEIKEMYPTIYQLGCFDAKQMQQEFFRELRRIEDSLRQQWITIKTFANKTEERNILVKKSETFKASDEDIASSIAKDFAQIRQQVKTHLENTEKEVLSRVLTLIQNRSFSALKDPMNDLKERFGMDTVCYQKAKQQLDEHSAEMVKQKRKKLKQLEQKELKLRDILSYREIQQDLVEFYSVYKTKQVGALMKEFTETIGVLESKLKDELDNCLANNCITNFERYFEQFEVLEINLLRESTGGPSSEQSKLYKKLYQQKLSEVEENIKKQANDEWLYDFFKKNGNVPAESYIAALRGMWDDSVVNRFSSSIISFNEAKSVPQATAMKDKAFSFLIFMEDKDRKENTDILNCRYGECLRRLEQNLGSK